MPRRSLEFVKESVFPIPPEVLFAFHERPDAFALLQPPWETVEILTPPASLAVGTRVELRTRIGPFWKRIVAEHVALEPGRSFEDVMIEGPFAAWHHKHLCLPHPLGSVLRDEIHYRPPLGWFGRMLDPMAIRPRLRRMFDHRHAVTRRELDAEAGPPR